jgi:hypothetical protein
MQLGTDVSPIVISLRRSIHGSKRVEGTSAAGLPRCLRALDPQHMGGLKGIGNTGFSTIRDQSAFARRLGCDREIVLVVHRNERRP